VKLRANEKLKKNRTYACRCEVPSLQKRRRRSTRDLGKDCEIGKISKEFSHIFNLISFDFVIFSSWHDCVYLDFPSLCGVFLVSHLSVVCRVYLVQIKY